MRGTFQNKLLVRTPVYKLCQTLTLVIVMGFCSMDTVPWRDTGGREV